MDKLFITILNMSLTGTFVIAAICLARLPLKKAPKIISYCLWAVAGFRLVFPFSIECVFSLIPFKAQTIPSDIAMQSVPRIDSGISFVNNAVSSILPAAAPTASVNPLQRWTAIGAWVWIIGVAIMLIYGVVSFFILKRKMSGTAHVEENIYEAENINSPFVLGLFAPKIYLPIGLSEQEKSYIILHEQTHIKRHDHIVKFAAYFVLCLHWFNPLAWVAFLLMGGDMEMSCDERVLKEMGGETKKDYSLSLLSLATGRRMIGGSPLAFGEGGVKERIKNVLNFKKPSRVIIILAVALVVVLSVGFAVNKANSVSFVTVPEAQEIVSEHYPEATEIRYTGQKDISYTNPPAPVDVYTFEVDVNGERIICAVSTERGIFFTYSDDTWWAFTGGAKWSGETRPMTLADVRTIAEKIGPDLTLNDLREYTGTDIGSGLYLMLYEIDGGYRLIASAGSYDDSPMIVAFGRIINGVIDENAIDIRYYDVDKYVANGTQELVRELPEAQETTPPASTYLETAISEAILESNRNDFHPGDFAAEAHTTLATVDEGDTVTVYLMVLYQVYGYSGGGFSELDGTHGPVAITFDKRTNSGLAMTEYWTPRDGSYYAPSIKEKFPPDIYEDAIDTQKYISAHVISCHEQAIEYGDVDTNYQIASLIETICSSPAQASNPGAYIEAHSIEFRELVYYGRYTLDYCFNLFEQGGQTGLEGHIMAAACRDIMAILGETVTEGNFETGQDWYDAQGIGI